MLIKVTKKHLDAAKDGVHLIELAVETALLEEYGYSEPLDGPLCEVLGSVIYVYDSHYSSRRYVLGARLEKLRDAVDAHKFKFKGNLYYTLGA